MSSVNSTPRKPPPRYVDLVAALLMAVASAILIRALTTDTPVIQANQPDTPSKKVIPMSLETTWTDAQGFKRTVRTTQRGDETAEAARARHDVEVAEALKKWPKEGSEEEAPPADDGE